MNYIIYNKDGEILKNIICSPAMIGLQISYGEFVTRGMANDSTQKIKFDGFDSIGQPINPRVINKTPEEIRADNPTPPEILFEERIANVTNKQWQIIQDRLTALGG